VKLFGRLNRMHRAGMAGFFLATPGDLAGLPERRSGFLFDAFRLI
jgi:hypothetical protein